MWSKNKFDITFQRLFIKYSGNHFELFLYVLTLLKIICIVCASYRCKPIKETSFSVSQSVHMHSLYSTNCHSLYDYTSLKYMRRNKNLFIAKKLNWNKGRWFCISSRVYSCGWCQQNGYILMSLDWNANHNWWFVPSFAFLSQNFV